ncbi:MAG: CapA family protein [Pseudomonadota bacterium]
MVTQRADRKLAGRREILRAVVLATLGAMLFGGIALVANWGHAPRAIAVAVAGQMALCFAMTFTSATMMQVAFKIPRHPFFKFLAASAGVGLFSLFLMTFVHWLIGTPEIFRTVAGATAISFFYYVLFPLALLREYNGELDRASRNDPDWRRQWGIRWFAVPYGPGNFLRVTWHNIFPPSRRHRELTEFAPRQLDFEAVGENQCRIAFLGDLMPLWHRSLSFDESLKAKVAEADYLVANFEGSLGDGPKAFLQQKHDERILDALETLMPAERIYLSVANNHAADFDFDQYQLTNARLRERGFHVFGTRDEPAAVIEGGINLVGVTQWTNQRHGYLPFLEHAVDYWREGLCNVLYPHWGYELECYPRPDWIERAKDLCEDFDAIVGHHSHIPAPVALYPDSQGHKKLVAYSLGDATTGMTLKRYQHGLLLTLDICCSGNKLLAGEWQFLRSVVEGDAATVELRRDCPLFPGV